MALPGGALFLAQARQHGVYVIKCTWAIKYYCLTLSFISKPSITHELQRQSAFNIAQTTVDRQKDRQKDRQTNSPERRKTIYNATKLLQRNRTRFWHCQMAIDGRYTYYAYREATQYQHQNSEINININRHRTKLTAISLTIWQIQFFVSFIFFSFSLYIISFYYKNALLYNALGCAPNRGAWHPLAATFLGGRHLALDNWKWYKIVAHFFVIISFNFLYLIFCLFVVFVSRVFKLELKWIKG